MILTGVKPTTLRQYYSRVVQLLRKGLEISVKGLIQFLSEPTARKFAHASLTTWKSAVSHFATLLEHPPSVLEELIWKKALRGYKVTNPGGKTKVKGAITYRLVEELVDYAAAQGASGEIILGHKLQHAFGVRTNQVPSLSRSSISWSKQNNCYIYRCVFNKDPEGMNRNQVELEEHYSDPRWNELIHEALSENEEDKLVQGWCPLKANSYIRGRAAAHGWDSRLFWSDHGIRHGSAVDAARAAQCRKNANQEQVAEAQDLAVFRRTGHKSGDMRRFYAEDPKHRSDRGLLLRLLLETPEEISVAEQLLQERREATRSELGLDDNDEVDDAFFVSKGDEIELHTALLHRLNIREMVSARDAAPKRAAKQTKTPPKGGSNARPRRKSATQKISVKQTSGKKTRSHKKAIKAPTRKRREAAGKNIRGKKT